MESIDLTGQRFGKLVVQEKTNKRSASGCVFWKCLCDCGKKCLADTTSLKKSVKTSCGCLRNPDLVNKRFGMLLVIKKAPNKGKKRAWVCKCDCGNETTTVTSNLLRKITRSCGCLRIKHNGVGTKIYGIWRGINNRCKNKNTSHWKYYGARGIKVCEEWENSFEAFREWALSSGYRSGLQIDRRESDGDYCPENCRWVTSKVNVRNRRTIKLNKKKVVEIKKLILKGSDLNEIAKVYGIHHATVWDIANRRTWKDVPWPCESISASF